MNISRVGLVGLTVPLLFVGSNGATSAAPSDTPEPSAAHVSASGNVRTLLPGVTLRSIDRGRTDPDASWTVEVSIPATETSPDPDAPPKALSDLASAQALAATLASFAPRVEPVTTQPMADFGGGLLGYRLRIGSFPDKASADAVLRTLPAGVRGSSQYTGWDGEQIGGPLRVKLLTIDPAKFKGRLVNSFGADIRQRQLTSALSTQLGAVAGVNAGYFVFGDEAKAPGDPAGIGVFGGHLLSEAVDGRPAFVFRDDGKFAHIPRYLWNGTVSTHGQPEDALVLDGINRWPGEIRNCGGTPDDHPTALPLHDITCTDPDETVYFTPEFGAQTPAVPGIEAVLDSSRQVVALRTPGGAIPSGGSTIQATGSDVGLLQALAPVGTRLDIASQLLDSSGTAATFNPRDYVVNGGPVLLQDRQVHVTVGADGFVHPGDPSFYYGFVHRRNPRTIAGVDKHGRILLVTADGRSLSSVGLSLLEAAKLARSLGMVDAINLDGGGSTTMVVDGQVVNTPSDVAGERAVGDSLLVLPHH
jgi:hypothetical protein